MLYDETSGVQIPETFSELLNPSSESFVSKGHDDEVVLDKFIIEAYVYHNEGQASAGILKGLFASSLEGVSSGVIQEAKRFTSREADGKIVEIGVAVRLAVATNSSNLEAKLSPENLAAASQLGMAETRVLIKVSGFLGPLNQLPAVTGLNVTNYQEYLDAFNSIQDIVFSSPDDWNPTILGWKDQEL